MPLELPGARVHHLEVDPLGAAGAQELLAELAESAGIPARTRWEAQRLSRAVRGPANGAADRRRRSARHQEPLKLAADIEMFGPRTPSTGYWRLR